MIVKNEEENLPRCLRSVQGIVDEIVIVDTGSTDRTVEIANEFGAKVSSREWDEDFAAARNTALDGATGEWALVMDADEELVGEDVETLRSLLEDGEHAGFFFSVISLPKEAPYMENAVINPSIRLFRNLAQHRYAGIVHEQVQIPPQNGQVAVVPVRLRHYGYSALPEGQAKTRKRNTELLTKAIAKHPDDAYVHYCLGKEQMGEGRHAEALVSFSRSRELLPEVTPMYAGPLLRNLALCYKETGRIAEALQVLAEGQQQFPDYTDLPYLEGIIYISVGEPRAALDSFERCFLLGDPPAQYNTWGGVAGYGAYRGLGVAYRALNDEPNALQAFYDALQDNPRDVYSLVQTGEMLLKHESPAQIRSYLEGLVDMSSPEILEALAYVYRQTGHEKIASDYEKKREKLVT